MKPRKPNWIDNLPNDKKSHVVFGVVLNPIIYAISILFFNWQFQDVQFGVLIGLISCIFVHTFIEIHQKITNTGRAEALDAIAGIYTAITFFILFKIIEFLT